MSECWLPWCIQATEVALIKQSYATMNEKLDRIEIKLDNLDNKYATKEEHLMNKERINSLYDIVNKLVWVIFTAIITWWIGFILKLTIK